MIKFREEPTIKFWHATDKKNVTKILKEGLKVSDVKIGALREEKDNLPKGMATGIIYLSTDLNNLVIDPRKARFKNKYALLEIEVPRSVYEKWDRDKDPVHKFYKTRHDYIIGVMKARYKRHPEKFPKFEEECRDEVQDYRGDFWENVYPKTYEYKMITEEIKNFKETFSLVIKNNIPPEYIKVIVA